MKQQNFNLGDFCPGGFVLGFFVGVYVWGVLVLELPDSAQALNASVEYDQDSDTFTTTTAFTSTEEIPAILSPSLP